MAEAFPAGEHLAEELEARGWTQADFAEVLGRPTQFVSEIISGKKEITRESAAQIAAALDTSVEFWLSLQDSYLLWKQSQNAQTRENLDAVKMRAQLRKKAPISLLRKRGYIKATDLEGQSREVDRLLGETVPLKWAARRSNEDETVTVLQRAWVACVKLSATSLTVPTYDREAFENLAYKLSGMACEPEAFSDFQALFAEVGVKLVYVEAFPGGKLDGCAMSVDGTPVIGISGRGKRLDIVLFTILHEVAHVLEGHLNDDGVPILDDLKSSDVKDATKSELDAEGKADQLASVLAIPGDLPVIPERVSSSWVRAQAEQLGVHPIVVVGRLQNGGRLSWKTTLVRDAPTVTAHIERWAALSPV
nr:HigA family addiction module antitoxin [Nesterenkonia sp. LB17]